MLTTEQKQAKLDTLIKDLANDLREEVQRIEASPDTTQNHYANYGALISRLAAGNQNVAKLISLALVKAGANRLGVSNAVKLFT